MFASSLFSATKKGGGALTTMGGIKLTDPPRVCLVAVTDISQGPSLSSPHWDLENNLQYTVTQKQQEALVAAGA